MITLDKEKYIITKKIAKHGRQTIVVIPKAIEHKLKPGTLAQFTIEIIDNSEVANG